jgi:hypothetical protein
MNRPVFVALLLMFTPSVARANCFDVTNWWELFVVRQAFDGGMAEGEPGSIGFVDPGPNSKAYFFLDAGVRTKRCQLNIGSTSLLLYPSAEWHHMDSEPLQKQDATNQGSFGGNAEYWFGNPDVIQPYVIGKAKYVRDKLNDRHTGSGSLLLSVVQTDGLRPSVTIITNNIPRGIYFPYLGFEYLRKLAVTADEGVIAPLFDGGTFVSRVEFELYPFNKEQDVDKIKFVVSGEYNYRYALEDVPALMTRHLNFFSLKATDYFDPGQTVGVVLSFDKGRAPATNFVAQQRFSIGLAIKR